MSEHKCAAPDCDEDVVWGIYHGKIGTAYACEEHMVDAIESVPGSVFCFRLGEDVLGRPVFSVETMEIGD